MYIVLVLRDNNSSVRCSCQVFTPQNMYKPYTVGVYRINPTEQQKHKKNTTQKVKRRKRRNVRRYRPPRRGNPSVVALVIIPATFRVL